VPTANAVTVAGTATVKAASSVILIGNATSPAATSAMLTGTAIVAGVSGVGNGINKSYKLFILF
jgi:hypothetical protein